MSNNKVRKPNVVRGGIAVPLGRNYYYMRGRKHEQGGIDIGKNPRTGLEVEDGEVMHVGNKDIKVFSSLPFLNGKSPAQRVMSGENPNAVFNAQERFKKRNKINDDGTKKKRMGGLSRSKDYGSDKKPYPKVKSKDFAGKGRGYPIPTKADARDALRLAGLHHRLDIKAKVYRKYPELRKNAKAGSLYTLSVNGKQILRPYPSTGEIELSKRQELTGTAIMKAGGRKRKAIGSKDDYNPWNYEYYKQYRIASDPFVAGAFAGAINPTITKTTPVSTNDNSTNNGDNIPETTATAPHRRTTNSIRTTTKATSIPVRKTTTRTTTTRPITSTTNRRTVRRNATSTATNTKQSTLTFTPTTGNVNTKIVSGVTDIKKTPINMSIIKSDISIPSLISTLPKITDIKNTPIDINPVPLESANLTFRSKFRQYLRDNPETISDAVGLVSNLGSSLIGMGLTNHALNKMKYSSEPIPMRATKLKTRININPQLDRMRESLASYERNIDANTGSSQVALARKQRARLADVLGRNELYADKENKEIELINTDRINQQEVANKNIEAYNNWAAGKAAFENSIAEQKANNRIAAINNINAGVQQIVGNIQQRMADQRTLAALTLGSPNLPAEMFYGSGIWNKRMYDLYRRSYPLKRK